MVQTVFAKYKEHKPNLVFLDIVMPNIDGIECLKQIMAFDTNAKVIMCSSIGQQTVVNDAIKIGASDFIIKPFDAAKVLEAVSRICDQVNNVQDKSLVVDDSAFMRKIITDILAESLK